MNQRKQSMIIAIPMAVTLLAISILCEPLKLNDEWMNPSVEPLIKLEQQEFSPTEFQEIVNQFLRSFEGRLNEQHAVKITDIKEMIHPIIQDLEKIKMVQVEKKVVWAEFFEKSKAYGIDLKFEYTKADNTETEMGSLNFFIITKQMDNQVVVTYVTANTNNLIKE